MSKNGKKNKPVRHTPRAIPQVPRGRPTPQGAPQVPKPIEIAKNNLLQSMHTAGTVANNLLQSHARYIGLDSEDSRDVSP